MHREGSESNGFYVLRRQNLSGQFNICMFVVESRAEKRNVLFFYLKRMHKKHMRSCHHNTVVDENAALLHWQSLALPVLIDKKISAQLSIQK